MTRVTRWFIKAGMIWLIAGMVVLLVDALPGPAAALYLKPSAWHMIALGWITQLIIGVSVWMFPSAKGGKRVRETGTIWITFWLFNLGLVIRLMADLLPQVGTEGLAIKVMAAAAVLFQLGAGILYVIEIWPRIRGKKQRSKAVTG